MSWWSVKSKDGHCRNEHQWNQFNCYVLLRFRYGIGVVLFWSGGDRHAPYSSCHNYFVRLLSYVSETGPSKKLINSRSQVIEKGQDNPPLLISSTQIQQPACIKPVRLNFKLWVRCICQLIRKYVIQGNTFENTC